MATHALSQDLSGWSDKTLCRLASSQYDDLQYLQEAKNRGLSCGSGVAKKTNNSTHKVSSKSIFIADKTYNNFLNLPKEDKIESCGFDGYSPKWQLYQDLAPRIKGYNSKMDNDHKVEGIYSRGVQTAYLESITYAILSENLELKEELFAKLYDWASKDALSATMQCYSNGPKGLLKACEGEWSDPEGQDLAPVKDATIAIEIVMSMNYVYKLYFSDYRMKDERHKVIEAWFESFYHRIKKDRDFYFGNSAGWYFPNIFIKHSQNKNYKSIVRKMVKGLDEWTLADGSMKNRTTRGDSALWYHHTAIGEAFIIMEIARAASVEIPTNLENKLLKAVELFHDAYLDHSVIEPWAKKRHNSQASNGHQNMSKLSVIKFNSAWFYIFQMRYPKHRTTQWLKQELGNFPESLKSASVLGIPLACIYKALADYPETLAKKARLKKTVLLNKARLKKNAMKIKAKQKEQQIEDVSKLSIFELDGETLNLTLDKAEFIETGPFELERSEEYLQPYQLHKGFIQGTLSQSGYKNINFSTLVFKHSVIQEQKLVIHVDDLSVEPLKRHSDSLQKQCGSKVIEWGWLSFISKTNDIKAARNQQCVYDYYAVANDKPAWELFQTILGGTDSILDYLQTNVER